MHQLRPARLADQALQGGLIPAGQAGLADPPRQGIACVGNPGLPAADRQPALIAVRRRYPSAAAREVRRIAEPRQRQPVGERPHQQRPAQPQPRRGQHQPWGVGRRHQRVCTVRPFQRTWPRSRLRIASTKTPRKNSTGTGKISGIQGKRPKRRLISSNCRA